MPNIPDKQHKDEKEIRLFGEKSLREEAYRQKIIELEKEVMKLEALLKDEKRPEDVIIEENRDKDIFYEAAVSLEERVKKYIHTLETKASYISEKINSEAQNLIEQKRPDKQPAASNKIFIALSLLTLFALAIGVFGIFAFFKLSDAIYKNEPPALFFYERPENLKNLLQKSGFYNKQYTIVSLNYDNNVYKGVVELHFKPYTSWAIKTVASDIIENFKKTSPDKPVELNFLYEDNIYAKVHYSPILDETHFEFK